MKKIFAIAMLFVMLCMMSACSSKGKRCVCTSVRQGYSACRGIEQLGKNSNCAELNRTYIPSDDSTAIVEVKCVEE